MTNVLDKIIQDKKESLKILKKDNTLDALEAKIKNFNNFLDFKETIVKNKNVSKEFFNVSSRV